MSWERLTLRSALGATPSALPVLIYGTAWKKERTANLVYKALDVGFRAVDTAAQPKHYREDLVGDGIRRAIRDGKVRREDLYVCKLPSDMHLRPACLIRRIGSNQVYGRPRPRS
jgi:diketogulonate reductase-like aldo/keto reductase